MYVYCRVLEEMNFIVEKIYLMILKNYAEEILPGCNLGPCFISPNCRWMGIFNPLFHLGQLSSTSSWSYNESKQKILYQIYQSGPEGF